MCRVFDIGQRYWSTIYLTLFPSFSSCAIIKPEHHSWWRWTKLVVLSVLNDTGNDSKGSGSGNNHNHDAEASARLSALRLAQHDYDHGNDKDETIIVRVEVTDTGCGIEGSELTGPKLFCKSFLWTVCWC